jgi:hypothetical protein
MTNEKVYQLIPGNITKYIRLDESTIRKIGENVEEEMQISWLAQGHLTNVLDKPLEDVKIDVSYYGSGNSFLGLDKTGIFDEDELDGGSTMAFSLELHIPVNTEKCVINISCNIMPTGVLMNWLYKGKKPAR